MGRGNSGKLPKYVRNNPYRNAPQQTLEKSLKEVREKYAEASHKFFLERDHKMFPNNRRLASLSTSRKKLVEKEILLETALRYAKTARGKARFRNYTAF